MKTRPEALSGEEDNVLNNSRFAISDADLNKLRNKAELPLYFTCVVINVFAIAMVILSFVYFDNIGIAYYIAFGYLFINLFISLGSTFSAVRLNSVRISGEQFSDIYGVACRYAKILGMKKVPEIYVKQNGGIINAFASYFFFRNYVLINSDVFEVAYIKNKDIDAVSFILAHEMAHIAFNHTKYWYNAGILVSKFIPFLYSALSRAREYSCDNVAKFLCPQGKHGIFIILLGKHLYNCVNIDAYLKQAHNTRGWFEFYANATSSHPVPVRRIAAVYDAGRQRIL